MRVLIVTEDISVKGGGIARMVREFVPALAAQSVEVVVLTASRMDVEFPGVKELVVDRIVSSNNSLDESDRVMLRGLLVRHHIDVVHINQVNNQSLIEFLVASRPTVIHLHNYGYWCPGGDLFHTATDENCTLTPGIQCISNAYLKRCNNRNPFHVIHSLAKVVRRQRIFSNNCRYVVSSLYLKGRAIKAGIPEANIDLVAYGIDGQCYLEAQEPTLLKYKPGFLLFVGRLARSKGIEYLLEAFAAIEEENLKLLIVGDGYYRSNIEEAIKRHRLESRVEMLGWKAEEELVWLYQNCSMLVLPSIWDEVFGIVGLEAMAAGKPVVAFDVGGVSQWLESEKTGFLVESKDVNTLADRITCLLNDHQLAHDMGQNGYCRFEALFRVDIQAEHLIEAYAQAVTRRGKAHSMLSAIPV